MKHNRICCILALSIILALLVPVSAIPAQAAGEVIALRPTEGKIGDPVEIHTSGFDVEKVLRIYFSSDKADVGDDIDAEVTAYEHITHHEFRVPDKLTDGKVEEDVHGGDYYFYAIYSGSKRIIAVATFTVIDGEIELDPEEGTVGTEVKISGEGLRNDQKITVEYEGDDVDIVSGDNETNGEGQFICTIVIPESTIGIHTITVTDVSGNKPEAEFSVKPKITLDPTGQAVGKAVEVSGTGFGEKEAITITLDGYKIPTTPMFIYTNHRGSFNGSFLVPSHDSGDTREVKARDDSFNKAEAQLAILAGITLKPITSPTSPGHVGTELTVRGTGFIAKAMVTITYGEADEVIAGATATADGNFMANFAVPPSVAGSHVITATDGTTTLTSTFTMESQAPPMPVPLLPKAASTAEAEAYFDWKDVTDPSGVSYTLQVASDADFTTIVLEKEGLPRSEYTVTKEEKLESTEKEVPYYWRVKAVDGASNESEWAPSGLFYVGFSWTSIPDWVWYTFYGLGGLLLVILGFWVRRRFTE